jgi:hypothetical protein
VPHNVKWPVPHLDPYHGQLRPCISCISKPRNQQEIEIINDETHSRSVDEDSGAAVIAGDRGTSGRLLTSITGIQRYCAPSWVIP